MQPAPPDPEEPAPDDVPHDFRGWFARGLRFAQLGFPDRALEAFEKAEELEPGDQTVQFNLGTAHLSLGNFVQALSNLDRAIAIGPDNADHYGNRAVAHAALGEEESVARDVAKAIALGATPDGLDAVLDYVRTRVNPSQD